MGKEGPWAIVNKRGTFVFLALADNEDDMWRWHLGWPDDEDIAAAKKAGLRAVRVKIYETELV